MGEIAEGLIEGLECSGGCGTFFKESHGYPVLCSSCWTPKSGYQKATEEEIN